MTTLSFVSLTPHKSPFLLWLIWQTVGVVEMVMAALKMVEIDDVGVVVVAGICWQSFG